MPLNVYELINNSSLYNWMRYAPLPDKLLELATGKTRKTAAFYASFLERPSGQTVLDIGANKGNKTQALLALGCRVIAIEPERKALETLRFRFAKNERVRILPAGVSDQPGILKLFVYEARSGYNTLSTKSVDHTYSTKEAHRKVSETYEVPVTTLDALIAEHGRPYYIKIDVEGFEKQVIDGLNQPVPFISFEANLPDFIDETRHIIARLVSIDPNTRFRMSRNESMTHDRWLQPEELLEQLVLLPRTAIDIIVQMPSAIA